MIKVNHTYCGDALEVLKTFPDNFIDCVVTSPPYFGLRDYGVEGQLGLEKTPDEFVSKLTEVFTEVRRVLKPTGTLWLNLGDSYAGSGRGLDGDGTWNPGDGKSKQGTHRYNKSQINRKVNENSLNKKSIEEGAIGNAWVKPPRGYKPKDLIGIPWMVAFALRNSGWYLRQDIIWHKPNPMPESVTDRCTKAHEYIFLLSKSSKYYYDAEAIKVDTATNECRPSGVERNRTLDYDSKENNNPEAYLKPKSWNGSSFDKGKTGEMKHTRGGRKTKSTFGNRNGELNGLHSGKPYYVVEKANKRSVWSVQTNPFPEAHFATFPPELIVDCIKAGCPEGGIVLDPFNGSGTTRIVAEKLGRNSIGIELNPKYIQIENRRRKKELGMFEKIAS